MRRPLRRFALAALALAAFPAAAQAPASLVQRYQATITPAELAGHLYVYADDFMAGRDTGAPGQRFAARYLAGQYQTMGIAPRGPAAAAVPYGIDGYLQPFELEQATLLSLTVTATRGRETVLQSTVRADSLAGIALLPVTDP